jgi:hypothetical protein
MDDQRKVDLDTVYMPSKELLVKQIKGECVIIPLRRGVADLEDVFFKLSETAKAMWDQLDGKKTLKEIARELSLEYDAGSERIERELLGLAEELLKGGMLVSVKRT